MMSHVHSYLYSDYVPGIGECKCGAYKVWNRHTQRYEEHEAGESEIMSEEVSA